MLDRVAGMQVFVRVAQLGTLWGRPTAKRMSAADVPGARRDLNDAEVIAERRASARRASCASERSAGAGGTDLCRATAQPPVQRGRRGGRGRPDERGYSEADYGPRRRD